jgi:methyl-accepting chemotaxis protein
MRCWRVDIGSWVAAFVVIAGYLVALFELSAEESLALAGCLGGWAVVVGLASEGGRRLQIAPIVHFLDQESENDEIKVGSVEGTSAYQAIVSLPFWIRRVKMFGWLASIIVVPPMMWVLGFDMWLSVERIRSFAIISVIVSILGGMLSFYWAKAGFEPWRWVIAESAADSDSRLAPMPRHSLRKNLLMAITFPVLASLLLVVDVVSENMRDIGEERAARWASLVVEAAYSSDRGGSLSERLASQLPSNEFWPMPVELVELRPDRIAANSLARPLSGRFREVLDRAVQQGQMVGVVNPHGGSDVGAFHRFNDGTTLIAVVSRADFESGRDGVDWVVGLVGLFMLLIGAMIAGFTGGELTRSAENMKRATSRIAAGDLSPGILLESEGVFRTVGEGIECVRQVLRSVVLRMSETVESVDQLTSGISTVAADVVTSSADQVQEMRQASQVMRTIDEGFGTTSQSVASLTGSIDESSISVVELGAAGDELSETASVLSAKVDAVSGSLEQMVRSVAQVAGTSDKLAAASEETSSSMEEMASSMRAVDTSAETTANLSSEVVRIAELGQAKVVQTIAGMEAIREATDAAENVIRGLGARTSEIGGILDVIDDVADETGLLALNAAIIAAQAGEQGKAFSVVADEIKELADRVLASTKEIGGLIRAVQAESENAIGAIETGSASVMSGVDLSAEAGRTLEEITVASRESGSRITEIVAFVREQTKAASHVVALMERVRESAEEIGSAGTEQTRGNEVVYESALTMREVAQQVRRTTEDQSRGFQRIRENIDGMRSTVEEIAGSVGQQSGACLQVTEILERASEKTHTNEEAAEKIRVATQELIAHSETLREETERFRI